MNGARLHFRGARSGTPDMKFFPRVREVESSGLIDMNARETLWIGPEYVAFRLDTSSFMRIPWNMVMAITEEKTPGDVWPSAAG